jgi:hypothetical protein
MIEGRLTRLRTLISARWLDTERPFCAGEHYCSQILATTVMKQLSSSDAKPAVRRCDVVSASSLERAIAQATAR